MRLILIFAFLLCSSVSRAETFQGIGPSLTLGDIKSLFPQAQINLVKAAWVTSADGFYSLSGPGFPGQLYLAFEDLRPFYAGLAQKLKIRIAIAKDEAAASEDQKYFEILNGMTNLPTDSALTIKWMRWLPAAPIPVTRYIAKYGSPDQKGFSDTDMRPYVGWKKRGLYLTVSDDEKSVVSAEFQFTDEERKAACHAKTARSNWDSICTD